MPQSSKYLLYAFLAVQLLLNVALLNAAVIRRDKREIATNVTGITTSNNEVDSTTVTTEEDVGTSLLRRQSSGSDGTTTGKPLTDAITTNLSEDKNEETTLTGFTVDENTVGFGSNGLEATSYNEGKGKVHPATSVDERTTVATLREAIKNEFYEETSTGDETAASQSTLKVPTDIENGPTLREEMHTTDSFSFQSTTQGADIRSSYVTTTLVREDTTTRTTHPSVKIDETVAEKLMTDDGSISQVTVAHPSAKIEDAVAEVLVTDDRPIFQVTGGDPSVKIDKTVAEKLVTDDRSISQVTFAHPPVKIEEAVTDAGSISQVTVSSTTSSADIENIKTTDVKTTIEGTTSPGLKPNTGETVSEAQTQRLFTEESNGHAISTTPAARSHGLTDETTMKITTGLSMENLNPTDDTKPLTSTVNSDETTAILTSTEASGETPIQTTFYASTLLQDPLLSKEIKNSTPSSAEKRGKFIDDNYSSVNELRLPNTSDVWALAGLKSAGRVKSSELPNSLETSDEKAVNTSMVTKSLLDWSRVMSSVGMESETTVKITTTDVPTTRTTTTVTEIKTIHENEVEMLTTKAQPDVNTEIDDLADTIEDQKIASLGENEVDTKTRLETTTSLEGESTPERLDDTSLSQTDYIPVTTEASLVLLKGRDDAYIEENQVDGDSVEEKPPSPTTTTTTTLIPDLVATIKSETTNPPVNGQTTEAENTSTFSTSTLSAIDFTTSMPFLTSTTMTTTTTTTTTASTSTPSIAFNMDDRTTEPPNMESTPTPPPTATVEPSTTTTTTTTTTEIPAVTVMAATTETQTTEAHTPAIISNDAMTQNANNYNNYEVVNKTTTQFADNSSIEASEASTRVAPNWSLSSAKTTTATEVDRVDVDFDVTTASIFDYSDAYEIATPQPSTTVASTLTFAATSTAIPIITTSSSNSQSTTEDLDHIDSIQKISDTAETSIESNVIDPLHAGVASTTAATTTTTTTTSTTTTTENNQENMRMQSTGSGEMDSTSTTSTTTTALYDDSTTTLQSISTKKEDVYSIVPTIDSGFHVPKLVVDVTTMSGELAAIGSGGGGGEAIDPPDGPETDVNVIIAISVSTVGIVALILLVAFLYVMRKRQKQMSYGQRCRPVSLDAYSLDNVSVYNSVRRKGATLRASKRSYGNVAFDDPSLRHNVMGTHELAKYVEKKSSIWEEYRDVPQIIARADEVPAGCEDKNRYANVIPLPETRVILQQQNNDEKSEYINANYVRGPKDTTNYYIACQAPLDTTVIDFWRMIWEQNSRVIIMATDLIENGIDKCAEYLPPSVTLDNHTVFGDFQVTLKNREVKEKYAISTLMLRNNATEESREITHYWYQWPESGVPTDEAAVIAMLLEARSSLKLYTIEQSDIKAETIITDETQTTKSEINGNVTSEKPKQPPKDQGPLTIHCSPGTGRTGTILACDIAMRCLEEPKRSVDIPQIVYSVRRGRASAVQTKEQYEFIYKVTHMYATKISNLNNDN